MSSQLLKMFLKLNGNKSDDTAVLGSTSRAQRALRAAQSCGTRTWDTSSPPCEKACWVRATGRHPASPRSTSRTCCCAPRPSALTRLAASSFCSNKMSCCVAYSTWHMARHMVYGIWRNKAHGIWCAVRGVSYNQIS